MEGKFLKGTSVKVLFTEERLNEKYSQLLAQLQCSVGGQDHEALDILLSMTASDASCRRELVIHHAILPILFYIMQINDESIKPKCCEIIRYLARNVENRIDISSPAIGILTTLVKIIENPESTPNTAGKACAAIMNLAKTFESAIQVMRTGVYKRLLSIVVKAGLDPQNWKSNSIEPYAMLTLVNLAQWDRSNFREILINEGAIDILTPFLTFQHFQSLPATMTIAFLGGRQEEGVVTDLLSSLPDIVDKLTDLLDNTVHKKGGKEYDSGLFNLDTILRACRDVSTSDANKVRMATPQVAKLLLQVIKDWCKDMSIYDIKFVELALKTLLHLTFATADDADLIEENGFLPRSYAVEPLLIKFIGLAKTIEDAEDALVNAQSLLSRIDGFSNKSTDEGDDDRAHTPTRKKAKQHIMISYCWKPKANPQLVAELAFSLRDLGFETWRDVEGSTLVPRMGGSVQDRMAEAIEQAHTVIICVSRDYKVSPNCRLEANYANQRQAKGLTKMIYVMMEDDYTTNSEEPVDGYLGLMVGSNLWYPLWDSSVLPSTVQQIADYIGSYYVDRSRTYSIGEIVENSNTRRTPSISATTSSSNLLIPPSPSKRPSVGSDMSEKERGLEDQIAYLGKKLLALESSVGAKFNQIDRSLSHG